MLPVCSCVLGKEGAGRCAGCLLMPAKERGRWSLCWLSARVCYVLEGERQLVALLAVCSSMLGEDGNGRCAGCLLMRARGRGNWSLCWLSPRVCLGKRELVAVLAVCSCVLGKEGACRCAGCLIMRAREGGSWSCLLRGCLLMRARERGSCRCAGCLLMPARERGSWSLCWLAARVCLGKRELVAVLAVYLCVVGKEGAGRSAGCLLVCARGRGNWSLCCLSARVLGEEGAGRCAGCLLHCARIT